MSNVPVWIVRRYRFASLNSGDSLWFEKAVEARDVVKWFTAWGRESGSRLTAASGKVDRRDERGAGWRVHFS